MADYENGLPPVTKSEGKINSLSYGKDNYRESDSPQVNALSFNKEEYNEMNNFGGVSAIGFSKVNYSLDLGNSTVSSLSYAREGIGSNTGCYL